MLKEQEATIMIFSNSPKLSISIPIYNVENYLVQCLESVINQTLIDIEIILVDDGSTDSCGYICDEYAKKDSRIIVIHKENGGLASARQAALNIARGTYFCACDADDWVEKDMYQLLYNEAIRTDADIVMCDYFIEYEDGRTITSHLKRLNDCENIFLDKVLNGNFPNMVWNKIYKRDIFQKYNIYWEQGIDLGEDFLISLKIFQNPIKISCIQKPLYHYRRIINSSSYTNNVSYKTFKQNVFIRIWIKDHIDTNKYKESIFRLWLNSAFTGLRVKDKMDKAYYKNTVMKNLPLKGFFKYKYSRKKGILILFTKVFGYNLGKTMYTLFYKYYYH